MNLIRNYRNWRVYRDTVNELGRLSNRQLHDLGIIRGDINIVRGDINTVRGEINLLKWMNGITWALCFGILFKLFLH